MLHAYGHLVLSPICCDFWDFTLGISIGTLSILHLTATNISCFMEFKVGCRDRYFKLIIFCSGKGFQGFFFMFLNITTEEGSTWICLHVSQNLKKGSSRLATQKWRNWTNGCYSTWDDLPCSLKINYILLCEILLRDFMVLNIVTEEV